MNQAMVQTALIAVGGAFLGDQLYDMAAKKVDYIAKAGPGMKSAFRYGSIGIGGLAAAWLVKKL